MNRRLAAIVFAAAAGLLAPRFAFAQCAVDHLELVPNPADNLVAGAELLVTVTARDAANNIAACYRGRVQLSAGPNVEGLVFHTFTEEDAGVHTFSWSITSAGERALNVYDSVNALSTYFHPYTVVPGPLYVPGTFIQVLKPSAPTQGISLYADGLSTALLKVTLKDQHYNQLMTGGHPVVLSTPGGTIGPITDHGDGIYTATLTAGLVPGIEPITVSIDGETKQVNQWFLPEIRRFDFNRDNKADILWRETATGQLILWTMNGGTILSSRVIHPGGNTAWTVEGVGDFDGDGDSDIVWRNGTWILVWLLEDGTIVSSTSLHTNLASEWVISAVADFDHDGRSDLLFRNDTVGQWVFWYLNGSTISSTKTVQRSQIMDPCEDRGIAFQFTNYNTPGGRTILLGINPFNTWRASYPDTNVNCSSMESKEGWSVAALGDFDRSGSTDTVWRNLSTGATEITRGAAEHSYNKYWRLHAGNNQSWTIVGAADFTGDDIADVLWRNNDTGATLLWEMQNLNDTGFFDPNAHILSSTLIHNGGNLGYQIIAPRMR